MKSIGLVWVLILALASVSCGTKSDPGVEFAARFAGKLTDVVQVSASYKFACAVKRTGTAYCWGRNSEGQLGSGSSAAESARAFPVRTEGGAILAGVVEVSAGGLGACARLADQTVYCWGGNQTGQLGTSNPALKQSNVAVQVRHEGGGSPLLATSIAAGGGHACATSVDSRTYCWGSNSLFQLGTNRVSSTPGKFYFPVAVTNAAGSAGPLLTGARRVFAGGDHSCATVESAQGVGLVCWGLNSQGELGANSLASVSFVPLGVVKEEGAVRTPLLGVEQVALGLNGTCAIDSQSRAWCWGNNYEKELGNPNYDAQQTVSFGVRVKPDDSQAVGIGLGFFHSCRVDRATRKVQCWGRSIEGYTFGFPYPSAPDVSLPPGGVLEAVDSVAVGAQHTCAAHRPMGSELPNVVSCWGAEAPALVEIGE